MAASWEVTCTHKTNRTSASERISHLGGKGWKRTQAQMISNIENGFQSYHVVTVEGTEEIIIALVDGKKYLKTRSDSLMPVSLIQLPECP